MAADRHEQLNSSYPLCCPCHEICRSFSASHWGERAQVVTCWFAKVWSTHTNYRRKRVLTTSIWCARNAIICDMWNQCETIILSLRDKALLAGAGSGLNQEQLEERQGERERDRGRQRETEGESSTGKAHDGLSLPGLQTARVPLWNVDLLRGQVTCPLSGHWRMKKGLVGRTEGEAHPWPVACTANVFSLTLDVIFFKLWCCFSGRRDGGRGAGQKPLLPWFLPTQSSLEPVVKETQPRPPGFPQPWRSCCLHLRGLCAFFLPFLVLCVCVCGSFFPFVGLLAINFVLLVFDLELITYTFIT